MSDDLAHRGPNDDGFLYINALRQQAKALDAVAFLQRFTSPALRVLDPESLTSTAQDDDEDRGVQLLTERIEGTAILRYLGKIAFIAKRPGNPYPHLISIGRSRTNDLTISVDSVSKVHGYFVHDEEGWHFTDHSSTNGTHLDDQSLDKGKKYRLRDGVTLRLGLDASFRFHEPSGLYRALTEA